MTIDDFRRIALSMDGAEEGSHMGSADFRVGGRIFATLASQEHGYGNLMLTPEQQSAFVEDLPEIFLPVHGGWGRMGATHIRLSAANEDVLTGALHTAWKRRVEANSKVGKKVGAKVPAAKLTVGKARSSNVRTAVSAQGSPPAAKKSSNQSTRKKPAKKKPAKKISAKKPH
ncbi:MAG TPA: MmcQ/YjbR family DNA-binding protein [Candidatus Angelobacter sp.]|nr:MmcQ/YjbR family DNA-binding protein [Candidatus Angelobacter sp.]